MMVDHAKHPIYRICPPFYKKTKKARAFQTGKPLLNRKLKSLPTIFLKIY